LYHLATDAKIKYLNSIQINALETSSSHLKQDFIVSADQANSIQDMFNAVAPKYDFLNALLSAGFDRYWRKITVDELKPLENKLILDVATGTAEIAIELAIRGKTRVIGIDFSAAMLELGKNKIISRNKHASIKLLPGTAENLPLKSDSFDGTVTAFGARNFYDINHALAEMHRVLKPKGKIVILEFSFPQNNFLKWLLSFIF
jgi:demethylmenaquinone methyltransferase / 2-methoxy-6-polyprenyl-1,4-benzoquinol methylase